jgi:hypothetical protein
VSLTVGRVGLDVPLTTPTQWNQTGDRVSVAGQLRATTATAATVLRQQLAAYAAGDAEDVVPVTWDQDPTVDGYYRVLGAAVGSRPASLFAHFWDFTLELERVADGWRRTAFESVVTSAWGANFAGRPASNAVRWCGLPLEVTDLTRLATTIRYGADGNVGIFEMPTGILVRWGIAPEDYYRNAATIRVAGQTVAGKQVDGDTDPYGWTIGNGVMECRLLAATEAGVGVRGDLALRWRKSTGWGAWKGFRLGINDDVNPAQLSYAVGVRVIRNSPAEVVLRVLSLNGATGTFVLTRHTYDLSIRRGADTLTIVARSAVLPHGWKLQRSVVEAAAQVAGLGTQGAIQAAAADADGFRYVLASPLEYTRDLTNGRIRWDLTNLNTVTCAIGAVVPTVSTLVTEDAVRLVDRYFTSQGEWLQPISW